MVDDRENFPEYEEFHLINYVNVILKRRWMIIIGVLICVILTGIYSKNQAPIYTASAKFLPSKDPEMTSQLQIGTSRVQSFQDNVTSEYYAGLLKRSLFLERIAKRKFFSKKLGKGVDLISYYGTEDDDAGGKLLRTARIIGGNLEASTHPRTKVITVSYSTGEPELSAAIVDSFLEELIKYNQDIRNTKAKQNREFIEDQLEENRKLLKDAEAKLADFTAKNKKIVTPDLEIELDRLKRNVKVQEEVFITLKRQLELAKIEEQEKKPAIEIIEKASIPLFKSFPRTKRSVILSGIVSFIFFIGLAFILEYISKINPESEGYKEFFKHLIGIKNDLLFITRIVRRRKKRLIVHK